MKLLVGFVTICGSVAADSAQVTDSAVLLPVMRSVPSLFASDSTWFGSFTSHSHGLFADRETGIAKAHFFVKGPNADPFVRLTVAESAHLDSRTVDCEVNLRFAKLNESALTAEVRVESGTEYVVSATIRQTVLSATEYHFPDIYLLLEFYQNTTLNISTSTDAKITFQSRQLKLNVELTLRKGIMTPEWTVSPQSFWMIIAGLIWPLFLIPASMAFHISIFDNHMKHPYHISSAQGAGAGCIVIFIFAHYIKLNLYFIPYHTVRAEVFTKIIWLLALATNMFFYFVFCILNLDGLNRIKNPAKFISGAHCILISVIGLLSLWYQNAILDAGYYDLMMSIFYGYPFFQVYYIAFHSNTNKQYYFSTVIQTLQSLWTLSWCFIIHFFEVSNFELKSRGVLVSRATLFAILGWIVIYLQSRYGKLFFLCQEDNTSAYEPPRPVRQPPRVEVPPPPVNPAAVPQIQIPRQPGQPAAPNPAAPAPGQPLNQLHLDDDSLELALLQIQIMEAAQRGQAP